MRMVATALVAALAGVVPAAQAAVTPMPTPDAPVVSGPQPVRLSQGLPSDVEQKLGIPPNSANRDRRGGVPSDWERRGYRAGPRFSDRRHSCEQRGLRRGLFGWELRRFISACMDR